MIQLITEPTASKAEVKKLQTIVELIKGLKGTRILLDEVKKVFSLTSDYTLLECEETAYIFVRNKNAQRIGTLVLSSKEIIKIGTVVIDEGMFEHLDLYTTRWKLMKPWDTSNWPERYRVYYVVILHYISLHTSGDFFYVPLEPIVEELQQVGYPVSLPDLIKDLLKLDVFHLFMGAKTRKGSITSTTSVFISHRGHSARQIVDSVPAESSLTLFPISL